MKITLIRPRTGNTPDPPLGLMILSACAKRAGHLVQILDPHPDDNGFLKTLKSFNPDIIGLSILTTQISRTRDILSIIKESLPDCVIIAGGIHPTALPEWTLRSLGIDYVVIGEGEITFVELVDRKSVV